MDCIVSVTTFAEPEAEEIKLTVVSQAENQSWVVDSIHFDHYVDLMDLPQKEHVYLRIFQWAIDGKNLYFSKAYPYSTPCGSSSLLDEGGADLRKFNLETGETSIISDQLAVEMSLSPDQQKLVYTKKFSGNVILRDLVTEKEVLFPLPDLQYDDPILALETRTSGLLWSPDGKSLVYALLEDICHAPIGMSSNIVLIDSNNLSQEVILRANLRGLLPVQWEDLHRILLIDNDDVYWWLNLVTKEITPENQ